MIGQFFDTMIVASNDKQWLKTTYPNISAGNCFEAP